jgi:hypothetical protein
MSWQMRAIAVYLRPAATPPPTPPFVDTFSMSTACALKAPEQQTRGRRRPSSICTVAPTSTKSNPHTGNSSPTSPHNSATRSLQRSTDWLQATMPLTHSPRRDEHVREH